MITLWYCFSIGFPFFALVTPRAAYPWLLTIFVPLLAVMLWVLGRPVAIGEDWDWFGRAIVWLLLLCSGAAFVLRLIIAKVIEHWVVKEPPDQIDWRPFKASAIIICAFAALWMTMAVLARLVGPHVMLLAVLVFSMLLARRAMQAGDPYLRAASAVSATVLLLVFAYSIYIPTRMVARAEATARGSAYCLLVADGTRSHREPRSLADLTPFIANAPVRNGFARSNHAQVMVSGVGYHWSYQTGSFNAGADVYTRVNCAPTRHHAARLGWLGRN